jgi:hypothetical protein
LRACVTACASSVCGASQLEIGLAEALLALHLQRLDQAGGHRGPDQDLGHSGLGGELLPGERSRAHALLHQGRQQGLLVARVRVSEDALDLGQREALLLERADPAQPGEVVVVVERETSRSAGCGEQAAGLVEADGVDADAGGGGEGLDAIFHVDILRVVTIIVQLIKNRFYFRQLRRCLRSGAGSLLARRWARGPG